ncbi:MAG: mandelate racemase/muconate lactonizing enzyme family protein, partial [Burkholderiaceae bacterium]
SFWGGACGPVINAAMSAVDIACWDITGKALKQPIWKLLGGKVNADLRCYASQTQFGWNDGMQTLGDPKSYGEAAVRAIEQGYDAIKVDPIMLDESGAIENQNNLKGALERRIIKRATSRLAAIRDAIGPEIDIILELHSLTSLTGGQRLAEACAEFDLFMVEEAVNYNSDRPAKTLKQRLPHIRMTGGERIFTRWQYCHYLEDASFDMLQPDFCLVGGISEGRKICDMAHAYEVTIQGHVCGSPISTAAAKHIETSIPNFQIHEHHVYATLQDNRDICLQDPQPINGRYTVDDTPGLGLDLNEEFVRKNSPTIIKLGA